MTNNDTATTIESRLHATLENQRAQQMAQGSPSAPLRIDRINRTIDLLLKNQDDLISALDKDFGHRSCEASLLTDIMSTVTPLKHARAHVKSWMKPEKRTPQFPLGLLGAKAYILHEPLGTVGVISPWNFPVNLTFAPLAGIFAAGNRTMIKPSEFTPLTSQLIADLCKDTFDEDEVAVFTGGPEVGGAFSKLPFDHLLFTGATSVARHVMRAAAENLVPVTLELGGKSPVIVEQGAPMEETAAKIMTGKTMNAGQICLAPDYVLLPEESMTSFVHMAKKAVATMYPTLKNNPDYTSVINQRHHDRLQGYLKDAAAKGAEVISINPAHEDFSQQEFFKIPPSLVLNPTDDMAVMQEEIFGPILPVKTYKTVDEAISYVNKNAKPLGLYYFGTNKQKEDYVLQRTTAGGVTVNDVIMHIAVEDLPFGGVGPSGMGVYHGVDGFKNFSNPKAVLRQSPVGMVTKMFRPPFSEKTRKLAQRMM